MQKIAPFLWFDDQAEDAVKFYTTVFENSKVGRILRYGEEAAKASSRPTESVLTIEFEIEGQKFVALNGGPQFRFNESVSFVVNCETQKEVDYFWEKFTADGGEEFAVRLAQGQIRFVLASHPNCVDRHVAR
jgi:predicted 3-demethylubiquinone-9 3-methyltransferase (glyoxalase superfamily)